MGVESVGIKSPLTVDVDDAAPGEAEKEVTFLSDTPDIDVPATAEAQTVPRFHLINGRPAIG